jgi:hypothetical protein
MDKSEQKPSPCFYHACGYCHLKTNCPNLHIKTTCPNNGACDEKSCKHRHPNACRRFARGHCIFADACAYRHINFSSEVNNLKEKFSSLEARLTELEFIIEKYGPIYQQLQIQAIQLPRRKRKKKIKIKQEVTSFRTNDNTIEAQPTLLVTEETVHKPLESNPKQNEQITIQSQLNEPKTKDKTLPQPPEHLGPPCVCQYSKTRSTPHGVN